MKPIAENTRAERFDVAVVGAGVIGLSLAWRAAQRGLRVVVLDRGRPGAGTSRVAAGMIAPVSEAIASERPLLRLGLASARMYPRFVDELERVSGLDPGLRRTGTLLVARDRDEAEALERELALRAELALPIRRLLGSQARVLEPGLARVRLALEATEDHSIDPRALCTALARAAAQAGARIREGTGVSSISSSSGAVRGVRLDDGSLVSAETTVIAAGVEAARIEGLSPALAGALRPVKGQIVRLRDPSGAGLAERVIRMAQGYVVPRGDGRYVLGATMEERGFDRSVTAGGAYELLRDAIEILPGISELVIEEFEAGLRPGTTDNAPILGPDAVPGLIWATGHYRHGILLAPVTAELVTGWLTGEPAPGELSRLAPSFDPARFAEQPATGRPGGVRTAGVLC